MNTEVFYLSADPIRLLQMILFLQVMRFRNRLKMFLQVIRFPVLQFRSLPATPSPDPIRRKPLRK